MYSASMILNAYSRGRRGALTWQELARIASLTDGVREAEIDRLMRIKARVRMARGGA